MITTVTSVTTVTTMAVLGITAVLSMAGVVALMIFLAGRELASAGRSTFSLRLARLASVGVLPLLMAFLVTLVAKIADIL